ncbi:acetyl-CoA carboxylase, carboxytransferase, alpha subunit [Candidatus Terasakiella magnetica]|uniref:Acetyl-coenzyme A carboxylase carboxyl transferase subunit alpha n=1 Tax=Candidatus Terasakiella magnetica TaxID=1867952 RepID=A0A1C3RKZ9_9PROT|nr:acetyl-CoA carboxylase carboxyltransferase subunit alpha [Candidatus Terasakiella magnetica]SCA57925.1 acetyl-CoA carboxylase, carboxytransferase, alpha subunit [Candidatus Terasakiella magnetica]
MHTYLDFEKPIAELEGKIKELRHVSASGEEINIAEEVSRLQNKAEKLLQNTYSKLTPWQKTQVARHPERPHTSDYIENLIEDFTPLAGDRLYAEDCAIIGGLGRFEGHSVVVMGHEKGNSTETRVKHNFGMAKPEGYRKAQRLMDMAERFNLPIVTFVDTAGAFPGADAEERGQSEAIARSIEKCLQVKVPFTSIVIGEGGSGGAIAIACANDIYMLEHSIYSVISPEGCASILWRSNDYTESAADALNITAQDLHRLAVIDDVIPEPLGGAHRSLDDTFDAVRKVIDTSIREQLTHDGGVLKARRREKFLAMGRAGVA